MTPGWCPYFRAVQSYSSRPSGHPCFPRPVSGLLVAKGSGGFLSAGPPHHTLRETLVSAVLVAKKCPLAFLGILCNVAVPPAQFWRFQRTPQSSFPGVTVPFLCTWLLWKAPMRCHNNDHALYPRENFVSSLSWRNQVIPWSGILFLSAILVSLFVAWGWVWINSHGPFPPFVTLISYEFSDESSDFSVPAVKWEQQCSTTLLSTYKCMDDVCGGLFAQ